jgi:tight adherence protein B
VIWLAAVAVFAVLVAAAFAVGLVGGSRDHVRARARRLSRGEKRARRRVRTAQPVSVKRSDGRSVPGLEALARRVLPRQTLLRDRLARAGLSITIGAYLSVSMAVALVGLVGALIGGLALAAALPAGIAAGAALPHVATGYLAGRRRRRFLDLLPDAIDLIVRGVKSGLPVTESMAVVGRELADPVGAEFRRIADGIRFGRPLDEVLWDSARRLATPEFNFFVITISIQQETGGNLAETLANLSDILRKRKQMRLKIKALSSEAKASALILGCLPIVMFLALMAMNPAYESALINDPRGQVMAAAGVLSLLVGALVMAKMVRFEI